MQRLYDIYDLGREDCRLAANIIVIRGMVSLLCQCYYYSRALPCYVTSPAVTLLCHPAYLHSGRNQSQYCLSYPIYYMLLSPVLERLNRETL